MNQSLNEEKIESAVEIVARDCLIIAHTVQRQIHEMFKNVRLSFQSMQHVT